MGEKNCELNETHIQDICNLITEPEANEQSKIFTNEAFGYQKVIVERPLRLSVDLTEKYLRRLERLCTEAKETALYSVVEAVACEIGEGPHLNYNSFLDAVEAKAKNMAVKLPAKSKYFMKANLAIIDESAEPVIKKIYKAGKAEPNSLTRHFYKPIPLRTLDEIKADIFAIEQETEGLQEEIVGEAE